MQDRHITEKLSAYVNHELPPVERQAAAEHLLNCQSCRRELDEIKFGAALAKRLPQTDAPAGLWNEIEAALDNRRLPQRSVTPAFALFGRRGLAAAACALVGIIVSAAFIVFLNRPAGDSPETAHGGPVSTIAENVIPAVPSPAAPEEPQAENSEAEAESGAGNGAVPRPIETKTAPAPAQKIKPAPRRRRRSETLTVENGLPAWNVETVAGTPRAGSRTIAEKGRLAVGQLLETDANSRARVQVADIGQVDVAPNSRVRLVNTTSTEHRLSLERGLLQARILAPPRLFIVDTPSAAAVDLGCEYTLEVDREGNSRLHVTSGFVALERDGRESIVPAGAICLTRKGRGIGTPFAEDASPILQAALRKFDFAGGGAQSLRTIIEESRAADAITLWHLLSRVPRGERENVFDALSTHVRPPSGVTREGILRLDKKMLEEWWTEIEDAWFGW